MPVLRVGNTGGVHMDTVLASSEPASALPRSARLQRSAQPPRPGDGEAILTTPIRVTMEVVPTMEAVSRVPIMAARTQPDGEAAPTMRAVREELRPPMSLQPPLSRLRLGPCQMLTTRTALGMAIADGMTTRRAAGLHAILAPWSRATMA